MHTTSDYDNVEDALNLRRPQSTRSGSDVALMHVGTNAPTSVHSLSGMARRGRDAVSAHWRDPQECQCVGAFEHSGTALAGDRKLAASAVL